MDSETTMQTTTEPNIATKAAATTRRRGETRRAVGTGWLGSTWLAAPVVALLLVSGCGREGVTRYEVAKAPPRTTPRHKHASPGMGGPGMGGAGMAAGGRAKAPGFTVPEGWKQLPAKGMRLVSLAAGEGTLTIDASIVALPGAAGGLTANFNRWRRQVGLPPLSDADLKKQLQPITVGGANGHIAVLAGKAAATGGNAIVAVLIPHKGTTWFFKMKGTGAAIKTHVKGFRVLLRSINFAGAAKTKVEKKEGAKPNEKPTKNPAKSPDSQPKSAPTPPTAGAPEATKP